MIPVEKIAGGTIADLMYYIAILGVLFLIASLLRLKVPALKKLFIPASLIAGILGLLIGPNCIGWIPADMMSSIGSLSGQLISVVFACMFLGMKRTPLRKELLHDTVTGLGWSYSCCFIISGVICLVTGAVLIPLFHVNEAFSALYEIGFVGGHGTAGGMASVFPDEPFLWAEGVDLAMTTATIGLLLGIIGGIALINYAVRKNYTKVITEAPVVGGAEEVYPEGKRSASSYATVSHDVIEPFALHLGMIGLALLIGRLIVWAFAAITGYSSLPLFPFAMIGGWLLNLVIQRSPLQNVFDRATFQRFQGVALEIVVASAVASINLSAVINNIIPILIGSVLALAVILLWVFWLSPRVFTDAWFEHAIVRYGAMTGVAAVGYLLIRTADPDMQTDAATIYAINAPLSSPVIGGGLFTAALPFLVLRFGNIVLGLILCAASLAIVLVMRLLFWKKHPELKQR